jgi:hypothetical protein
MVDILLASLLEAIKTQNDFQTGNANIQDVNNVSDRFIITLTDLINQLINSNIESRRKNKLKERLLSILNTAPIPIEEVDLNDPAYIKAWVRQYHKWYDKIKALTNG